jgi:hypothetical protein
MLKDVGEEVQVLAHQSSLNDSRTGKLIPARLAPIVESTCDIASHRGSAGYAP